MSLIDTITNGDYMPHGHCFLWREDLLFMHVGGDLGTAAAYFAIPAALVRLVQRRNDLAFNWIFLMFALFIFLCGVTHVIDSINIWHGYYHIEGVFKVMTAAISLLTAAMVWRLLPTALAIPGHDDLVLKNKELGAMQLELEAANRDLESKVEARTRELERLASKDPLTGLSNRRELMEVMRRSLAQAQRYDQDLVALMLDIDDFKQLNDQYGHQGGDAVLVAIADLFRDESRASDVVGRYGGEEFMVLMPQTSPAEGQRFAERLLAALRATDVKLNGDNKSVTCSIGIAVARPEDRVDDLIGRADEAMYRAKAQGKDRAVLY